MAYKLTVVIDERNKRYTEILKRRMKFKNRDELIDFLIGEKVAELYSSY